MRDYLGRPLTLKESAVQIVETLLAMRPLLAILAFYAVTGLIAMEVGRAARWALSLPVSIIAVSVLAALVVAWRVFGRPRMLHGALLAVAWLLTLGPGFLIAWWLSTH